jgi:transcriptional regulator with PAS, ATPase and Fis domain
MQRRYIEELLEKYNGNKTMVAKNLGISRTTLWRILKRES